MTAAAHLHRRIVALLLLVTACGHAGCGRSLPIEPVESRRPPANAGAAGTPIVCARGLVACEGSCIDPRSNHGHCGASDSCNGPQAGEACDALAFCVDGACADSCPADYARCDGACTNGAVDPDHCGARDDCQGLRSGDLCGDGEVCADGDCQLACPPGGLACAGRCIDPAIDRLHCGASGDCLGPDAGQACSAGQFCADGSCTAACPPGAIECDGLCVDPLNDPLHCGASGACAGDDAGSVCDGGRVCFDGTCTDGCPPQTLECDGRCIDPLTDALHCGARGACDGDDAGERCMPQAACIGGLCLQPCDVGQVRCGDACIDPQTDATFCGAGGNCMGDDAGTMCTAEQVCRQGQCASCDGGEIVCDGTCIDPRSDRDFCGAASPCVGPDVGEVCPADEACVDGRCSSECPGDLVLCDGACIDPLVDRDHCGASGACDEEDAGSACAQGELCDLGSCVLDCPAGLLDCDGTCVQPEADPLHCGASGDCMGDAAGEVCADDQLCSAGVCVDSCPAGQSACVGGCVDPRTDRNNCGSCRQRCAPQESCVDGSCQCPAGLSACQQACLDLQTDVANCGACGNACAPGKRCQGGTCVCLAGFTDCGDHCANLLVDEQDCGGCGQACRLFETCGGGSCLCGAGFTRCDRGCTDTGRDARNCGGCGIACDDGQRCSGGQCLCEPGFIPCGGTCVDPRHDADHCGGCGNACAADLSCLDGGCGCGPGHAVCGGVCRDLFDDRNHCGGCDNACAADEACAGGSCRCLLHVDAEGGSDQADGTSWATALRTLQHALAVNGERGCAIWLTGGTHRPTDGDDRMATFELLGAVAIYGGFVGTEADPSERVDGAPPTVLSGDLGVRGQNFDNSYTWCTATPSTDAATAPCSTHSPSRAATPRAWASSSAAAACTAAMRCPRCAT